MFFHLKPAWLQAALWILLMSSGLAQAQEMPNPAAIISEVLSSHPAIRRAQHNVESAEAILSGSRAQSNPVLTLSAVAGDPEENSNSISQSLEISGQPRLRHEQAQARLQAAQLQLESEKRRIAILVYGNWLQLWESQHLAMMARLRRDLMTEMVRVTKRRYEVGEIPQNESLRVELAAAEAEADQRKAEAAYQAASRSLNLLRGISVTDGAELLSVPEVSFDNITVIFDSPALASSEPWTLEQTLASANDQFDVEALRQEQRASELTAELTGKERAPQLGLALYRSRFFSNIYEQGAQLSISIPLFDWGSISSKKKAQLAEAKAQSAQIDERVLELQREVAELWNQWQAAIAVRDILQTQASRYEELARESRVGYDLGLLTLTDVLQTETAFRQAGVQLIQSQAEIRRLELSLLERTNLPWPNQLLEEQ